MTYQYKGAVTAGQETAQELWQALQVAKLATQRAKASADHSARLRAENTALKEQARKLARADAARRAELGKHEALAETQRQALIALRKEKKALQNRVYELRKRLPARRIKPAPVTEIFSYSGPVGLAAAVQEAAQHNKAKKAA